MPKDILDKEMIMLVTFKCDVYPNITMLDDVALPLLKLMGQSGSLPGALTAEEVPAALARLKDALKNTTRQSLSNSNNDDEEEDVNLKTRAFPLIELLSCAAKEQSNVLWDKGSKVPF